MNTIKEFVEKLIERLEELKEDSINENCPVVPNSEDCEMEHSCASCFLNASIKIVKQLVEEYVPETNVGKWIPCRERLPEKEGKYLVFLDRWNVITFSKFKNVMGYKHFDNGYVIAWQPLPEAYKPEQQKEMPTDHFTERFNRVL